MRYYETTSISAGGAGWRFLSGRRGEKRGGSTITQQLAKNLIKLPAAGAPWLHPGGEHHRGQN
jgi:membrane carboxypeptidase/penicillin-binding protein